MMEEAIAKIEHVFLGYEDHGILTCMVQLSYGSASQGAGGYSLDRYDKERKERKGTAFGLEWLMKLMAVVGVQDFSKIEGRTVFALVENGKVVGLKPLPTEKGTPFYFPELSAEYREELER